MGNRGALSLHGQSFAPVTMGGNLREQIIHCALLHDLHLLIVKRGKGVANGPHQLRFTRQGLREMQRVTARRGFI
ncbi:hypothetical protein D3C80_1811350 [compost metagenome]